MAYNITWWALPNTEHYKQTRIGREKLNWSIHEYVETNWPTRVNNKSGLCRYPFVHLQYKICMFWLYFWNNILIEMSMCVCNQIHLCVILEHILHYL